MAISVRTTSTGTNNNALSTTISLPTGTTTGDLTIASFTHSPQTNYSVETGVITPPTGWTVLLKTSLALVCYRLWQSGDPSSITASSTASMWWGSAAITYSGVDATTPIDCSNSAVHFYTGSTTGAEARYLQLKAPSLCPNFNGSTLVCIFSSGQTSGSTIGAPSGLTSRVNFTSGPSTLIADKGLTDGTPTGDFLTNSALGVSGQIGIQVALKASGASAATLAAVRPWVCGKQSQASSMSSVTLDLARMLVQDQDMIVVLVNGVDTVTSAPAGYTARCSTAGGVVYTHLWSTGDSTAPAFTFSASAFKQVMVLLLRKIGTGTGTVTFDRISTASSASASPVSATAASLTATANELLLLDFGTTASVSGTMASTWSEAYQIAGPGFSLDASTVSAGAIGTKTNSWTFSGGGTQTAVMNSMLFSTSGGGGAASARPVVFVCT